jgi:hypothetical protein
MPQNRSPANTLFVFASISAALGCGSRGPVPVKGIVTVDGTPIPGAAVSFVPLDDKGRPAYGATDAEGRYELTTHSPGDGALPGEYLVTLVWEEPTHPYLHYREGAPKKKELLKDYLAWKEKHKEKPSPIPALYGIPATTPLKQNVPAPGGVADFHVHTGAK